MFFTVNWFGSDGFVRLGAVGLGVGASSGLSYFISYHHQR